MLRIAGILAVIAVAIGCSAESDVLDIDSDLTSETIAFQVLEGADTYSGEGMGKRTVIISDQQQYLDSVVFPSGPDAPEPDFSVGQVILANYGLAPQNGYSIEVTEIQEYDKYIVASLLIKTSGNCIAGDVITYPSTLAYVESRKTILVRESYAEDICTS